MSLFKNILSLAEGNDLTVLPEEGMKTIQSNIRKGAQDTEQKWANALELTHKAYEVSGVERPTPNMQGAWKQYEENIAYGVEQLSKSRGMDADWRMSSAMFHEAAKMKEFSVSLDLPGEENDLTAVVNAISIEDVIEHVKGTLTSTTKTENHEVKVEDIERNGVKLTAWLHGVRDNGVITIHPKRGK
jgi:hypothetical protein